MYVLCFLFFCPIYPCVHVLCMCIHAYSHMHTYGHMLQSGTALWLALLLQQSPRCVNPSAGVCFSVRPLKGRRVPEPGTLLRLAEDPASLYFLPPMSTLCPNC